MRDEPPLRVLKSTTCRKPKLKINVSFSCVDNVSRRVSTIKVSFKTLFNYSLGSFTRVKFRVEGNHK